MQQPQNGTPCVRLQSPEFAVVYYEKEVPSQLWHRGVLPECNDSSGPNSAALAVGTTPHTNCIAARDMLYLLLIALNRDL